MKSTREISRTSQKLHFRVTKKDTDFPFHCHVFNLFESWSNPRFDQDLNKFKTWKWKGKHGSLLVSLKWSFWGFMKFPCLKSKTTSLRAWLHKTKFRARGRYMIFLVWICLDLVYQLECLLYDIRRLFSLVFFFLTFFSILMPI